MAEPEECKGGECELRPQFDEGTVEAPSAERKVRLSTGKYVQLLIDARETDPSCWPPGLEEAASLIERARAIEEACIEKHGDFDPDRLSRKQSREYFEIQLSLDALQEEAGDAPLDLEEAKSEARAALDEEEAAPTPGSDSGEEAPEYDLPAPGTAANGFFAAPGASTWGARDEAAVFFASGGWREIPPEQRPENYA